MQTRLRTRARSVYTSDMLEHLLDPEFEDLAKTTSATLLAAQAGTAGWLQSLGSPEYLLEEDAVKTRDVFKDTTGIALTDEQKKSALLTLRTPAAVRHLAGMLSEYDWAFVEQANEIRSYVVAKLLEETKNGDPRIRLRALELTGKLTEVGSFTERVHVTKETVSTSELAERIRDKIHRLSQAHTPSVTDVTPKPHPESP